MEDSEEEDSEEEKEAASDAAAAAKSMDFDFADESAPSSATPKRFGAAHRELKGSARKKTTSFNSVISNMKRHQKMDAANRAKASPAGQGPSANKPPS